MVQGHPSCITSYWVVHAMKIINPRKEAFVKKFLDNIKLFVLIFAKSTD